MVNLIELEPKEGSKNGEDDITEYEKEELANTDEGIPLSQSLVIQRLLGKRINLKGTRFFILVAPSTKGYVI